MRLTTISAGALVLALGGLAHAQTAKPSTNGNIRVDVQNTIPRNASYFTAFYPDVNITPLTPQPSDQWSNPNLSYWITGNGDQGSGLTLAPVDEASRNQLKLPRDQGLIVTSVAQNSPAAQAGIQENDILLTLGDTPLGKYEDMEAHLKAAGDKPLSLVLLHQGKKKTLQVQPRIRVTLGPVQPAPPDFWIGISVTPITAVLRDQLQIGGGQGLVVTNVVDGGPAARAGLKANDILLSMNDSNLVEPADLVKLVQSSGEKPMTVKLLREGERKSIDVTPEHRQDSHHLSVRFTNENVFVVNHPAVMVPNTPLNATVQWANDSPWVRDLQLQGVRSLNGTPPDRQADELTRRLDAMSAAIKELHAAVDELNQQLKSKK